jgi:hypothetical protein
MVKRPGDSLPTRSQRPGKRLSRSLSPASIQGRDSAVVGSVSATQLSICPQRIAAMTLSRGSTSTATGDGKPSCDPVAFGPLNFSNPAKGVDSVASRTSHNQPTCFRISGIPSDWCTNNLEQALQAIDPELVLTDVELSELIPACYGSTQTALLSLDSYTTYFRSFERNEERHKVIQKNGQVRLVIDKHFYDLTPMNRPTEPIVAE